MNRRTILKVYRFAGPLALALVMAGLASDAGLLQFDEASFPEPIYTLAVVVLFGVAFLTIPATIACIPIIIIHRRDPPIWIPAFCLLAFTGAMVASALDASKFQDDLIQLSLGGLLGFGLTAAWFGWLIPRRAEADSRGGFPSC